MRTDPTGEKERERASKQQRHLKWIEKLVTVVNNKELSLNNRMCVGRINWIKNKSIKFQSSVSFFLFLFLFTATCCGHFRIAQYFKAETKSNQKKISICCCSLAPRSLTLTAFSLKKLCTPPHNPPNLFKMKDRQKKSNLLSEASRLKINFLWKRASKIFFFFFL